MASHQYQLGSLRNLTDTPETKELLRIRSEGWRLRNMDLVNHAERALALYCTKEQ